MPPTRKIFTNKLSRRAMLSVQLLIFFLINLGPLVLTVALVSSLLAHHPIALTCALLVLVPALGPPLLLGGNWAARRVFRSFKKKPARSPVGWDVS
jgi:hypothetical protein